MSAAEQLPAELVDAALSYADKGLPVFPCNASKRPLTNHGFEDATTDPEQIRRWWARWPKAMIGIPTGARSGFWALDVDDPETFEKQTAVELPATRRCNTGKGYHLLFRFDGSAPVSNAQRRPKKGWPFPELPGAEARGDGGYVIVPPIPHRRAISRGSSSIPWSATTSRIEASSSKSAGQRLELSFRQRWRLRCCQMLLVRVTWRVFLPPPSLWQHFYLPRARKQQVAATPEGALMIGGGRL